MAVRFDYVAVLRNSHLLCVSSSAGSYTSAASTAAGAFFEKFRAVFNPGHQNKSSAFEYSLRALHSAESSYKWEFQQGGSTAWVKFSSGLGHGTLIAVDNGAWSSSALTLPIQFKLSLKGSTNTITITNASSYMCAVRSWGPVAT